jgi:uncharacterized protein
MVRRLKRADHVTPEHTGTLLWRDQVLQMRKEKDAFFRTAGSPLPMHERASFEGLRYYDADPKYRFEAELEETAPEQVTIPRTAGDEVVYERVGVFRLRTPEGPVTLAAFRTDTSEGELFIPFKDATSATETYGGGRYLEAHPLTDGRWLVDFNAAYHPFCVYNEEFTCPLPPRENWAKVPIRAGERLP